MQAGGSKITLVRLIGTCTRVLMLPCMQKLWGSGGMLPQENVLNFGSEMASGYFGAQNITTTLCFSPGMVTGF